MDVDFRPANGLAALSTSPTSDRAPFISPRDLVDQRIMSPNTGQLQDSYSSPRRHTIFASSNFLDSILNSPETMEPRRTHDSFDGSQSGGLADTHSHGYCGGSLSPETPLETDAQVAFLLRHFSEGPGKWYD